MGLPSLPFFARPAYPCSMKYSIIALLLLAVPAAAKKSAPKKPRTAETSLEQVCKSPALEIKILPDRSAAQDAGLPYYKPSVDEEAAVTAKRLGGRVQTTASKDGSRSLRWSRGRTTPAQCVEMLTTLGRRMGGRVQVRDPRYARSRAAVRVGVERSAADVARTGNAMRQAGPTPAPGFFERFFDGGLVREASAAGFPGGGAPGAVRGARSGGARTAFTPSRRAYRDGTPFPRGFDPRSGPPPAPGGRSGGFFDDYVRPAARSVGRGLDRAGRLASNAWRSAGDYVDRGVTWARENLLRAPLAHFTRISSQFGSRFHPIKRRTRHHSGVDYAAPHGTAVQSAGDGVVVHAGPMGGYGNTIVVRHASGTQTLYGHLSSIGVRKGQPVTQGRVIGRVGSTGQSTGPHLHYEVRRGGVALDPLKVASL